MAEKILFVDDEPNILQSIKRQLRKRFPLETAVGGEEALRVLEENGPFAVIVSDMRMPGMNGIELLAKVKDLYPDMIRLMLTGNADLDTAMNAVNDGHIFRFLIKPCNPATFITSLALAQRQHRLINSEKELLQETLKSSINVLAELLSIVNPLAFSSGTRVSKYVLQITEKLNLQDSWQYEIASMMSQIGCITIPPDILKKHYDGQELNKEEQAMLDNYPEVGSKMLEKIPRLENVTKMIAFQQLRYDEYTEDITDANYSEVLLGSQILKAIIDFDLLIFRESTRNEAVVQMRKRKGYYNPKILKVLESIKEVRNSSTLSVRVQDIVEGMVPLADVFAKNGVLIIPKGQTITIPLLRGLKNFVSHAGVIEPITVQVGSLNEET